MLQDKIIFPKGTTIKMFWLREQNGKITKLLYIVLKDKIIMLFINGHAMLYSYIEKLITAKKPLSLFIIRDKYNARIQ